MITKAGCGMRRLRGAASQGAWVIAAVILLTAASCQTQPLTRTQSGAAATRASLVVSEMREEGSTVWAVNPTNIQDKRVLGSFPHQPGFPLRGSISPDERILALVQLPPGADRFTGARLLLMNNDGSGQRVLEEGIDYDILPLWSPDSKELAFVKRSGLPTPAAGAAAAAQALPAALLAEVYVSGADGKNRRLLFKDSQSLDLYLVAWTNDGKRLVYRRFSDAGDEVWAFDMTVGQSQRLSSLGRAPAYGVRLSPDGGSIVASVRQNNSYDVISQTLDGQNRRVLSKGNRSSSSPIFAPDGRRIAFDVEPPQQGAAVGIMETGADTISRLSSPAGGKEVPLLFSPDGEWLLVRHYQEGRSRAFIMRIKDGLKEYLETAYWVEPIGWVKG